MTTTLYRVGDRLFSLDHVQYVDLNEPVNNDRRVSRSQVPRNVRIVLASGLPLEPFTGPEAILLRSYLTGAWDGRHFVATPYSPHAGLVIIHLELVRAADEFPKTLNGEPIPADQLPVVLSIP